MVQQVVDARSDDEAGDPAGGQGVALQEQADGPEEPVVFRAEDVFAAVVEEARGDWPVG